MTMTGTGEMTVQGAKSEGTVQMVIDEAASGSR